MFAFTRVFGVYILTAAVLTWALFAFGLAEELELPGFETTRAPIAAPVIVQTPVADAAPSPDERAQEPRAMARPDPAPPVAAVAPTPLPAPAPPVAVPAAPPDFGTPLPAEPAVKSGPPPTVARADPERAKPPADTPVIKPTASVAAPPPAVSLPPSEPKIAMAPLPAPQPMVVVPLPPPPKVTPPPAPKVAAPAEIVRPAPLSTIDSTPSSAVPVPAPPVAAPVRQAAPSPPPPAAAAPPRIVELAPPSRPADVAAPRARAVSPSPPAAITSARRAAVPMRRVAGFGHDALIDQLEDATRPRDDLPCVAFDKVQFRAGTARPVGGAPSEIEMLAMVLAAVPGPRVEIGSRIGTVRMTPANRQLAVQRARYVHDELVRRGIPSERLTIDAATAFHELMDDVGRMTARRLASVGVCVLPPTR